jgi:hypothetical protein
MQRLATDLLTQMLGGDPTPEQQKIIDRACRIRKLAMGNDDLGYAELFYVAMLATAPKAQPVQAKKK